MRTRSFLFLPLEFWFLSLALHFCLGALAWSRGGSYSLDLPDLTLELAVPRTASPTSSAPRTREEVWGLSALPKARPKTAVRPPAPPAPEPSIVVVEAGPPHLYSMAELAKPPQPLVKVKPAYPIEARRLGIEGVVTFQVDIDATGAVKKVTLVKGLGHGCDQAAMEALWKTPFSPGIAPDGRAVPSQRYYPFGFDLNDVDAP